MTRHKNHDFRTTLLAHLMLPGGDAHEVQLEVEGRYEAASDYVNVRTPPPGDTRHVAAHVRDLRVNMHFRVPAGRSTAPRSLWLDPEVVSSFGADFQRTVRDLVEEDGIAEEYAHDAPEDGGPLDADAPEPLTPVERELMRMALGVDNDEALPHTNHFQAWSENAVTWDDLEERGLATSGTFPGHPGVVFFVTLAGREALAASEDVSTQSDEEGDRSAEALLHGEGVARPLGTFRSDDDGRVPFDVRLSWGTADAVPIYQVTGTCDTRGMFVKIDTIATVGEVDGAVWPAWRIRNTAPIWMDGDFLRRVNEAVLADKTGAGDDDD